MVAGDGDEAEEEIEGGEDVGGAEGAPVGSEVSPQLHLGYCTSSGVNHPGIKDSYTCQAAP